MSEWDKLNGAFPIYENVPHAFKQRAVRFNEPDGPYPFLNGLRKSQPSRQREQP